MEPKREDKRKKKRKKQRQAMLAKAIPVVIAIVLIIALVGIFYGETLIESVYYTSEREDLYQYFGLVESDDVAMIMQDAHIDEKAKLVDGNCYFDMATVDKRIDTLLTKIEDLEAVLDGKGRSRMKAVVIRDI